MILSDKTIKAKLKTGEITIKPFDEKYLQPASYDLHLDSHFLVFNKKKDFVIDVKQPMEDLMQSIEVDENKGYVLQPGEFVLANVKEVTGVDGKHIARLEGKSSLGRLGLAIHVTAGFLDPGNSLRLTLHMINLSPLPIKIYPGMKIAQIIFELLDQECERKYGADGLGNKYVGTMTVKGSEYWKNFENGLM
ncbi:MAG: Deoxycytidine triphosphate deaminase [candidate division WS6 bacterium GW2011_GWC2_36_7]|uniref:dCTP deaminase, dUMP-forming n=2 Tax=Candidatus Dojkabacteria TaxID=74243 RepID=A0A0G0FVS0_9BACT|nr:MAG: Deoxycytidine triphosphate deaminase [candidate division WS6 bacterium GW2011_GWC2_36_7]KKQ17955.1 MAG: Deoxycytidine triphosphate deaminase [candidate division WS6 bacterium GW2011_GWF1_36_8]